jgi:uncharacterized DUF497 family protein
MIYQWDARKAAVNLKKHGVSFEDAATVFSDALALTYADPDHSVDEHREITIGHTIRQQLVFVAHCDREGGIRVIGARLATRSERRQYEEISGKSN